MPSELPIVEISEQQALALIAEAREAGGAVYFTGETLDLILPGGVCHGYRVVN